MIQSFKDKWLQAYWLEGVVSKKVPTVIATRLLDKLDLISAARTEQELRCPPGNKFEHLKGNLHEYCSIRINQQWRLIFKWQRGKAIDIYLDAHEY